MARGKSGRVVLEIDPELKQQLYLALEQRQQTMKEWFVAEAQDVVYGEVNEPPEDEDKKHRLLPKGNRL